MIVHKHRDPRIVQILPMAESHIFSDSEDSINLRINVFQSLFGTKVDNFYDIYLHLKLYSFGRNIDNVPCAI